MSAIMQWADLRERLERAEKKLRAMSEDETRSPMDRLRLEAKTAGVSLALSYMRDYGDV